MEYTFFNRIKNFVPTFKKNQIVDSAERTYESVMKHTLPVIDNAAEMFQGQKLKSAQSKKLLDGVSDSIKGKNAFDSISRALKNGLQIIEFCNQHASKMFADTEARQGLTYAKYTLMRTVQACEFANVYSRKLLNYVLAEETVAVGGDTCALSKAEKKWVEDNHTDFCIALKALDRDVKAFQEHLQGLPDAIITEATERTFSTTIGQAKYDPMNLRNFSVSFNPFLFIGMLRTQWQESRYTAAQEDLQLLQMRLLQLQRAQSKQADPKLEKQVAYNQDRVTELAAKIAEMEKDWKLEE
jgi:hypothetical protein